MRRTATLLLGCACSLFSVAGLAVDSIAFTSSRQLAREAVGCTLASLGGIDKERALYAEWASAGDQIFSVTGGETFVDGRTVRPDDARALADGLKGLGVKVLAPSAADLALLPRPLLEEVVKRSGARWIATNVQAAAVPQVEKVVVQDGTASKLRFLSLVPCDKTVTKAGWRCTAPEKALRETLAADKSEAFTVVVTTLPTRERDRLVAKYPAVSAWLDARGNASSSMEARSLTSVVVETQPYGMFAVRLQLEGSKDAKGPFVDAMLLEDARRAKKTRAALRRAIESFAYGTSRRLRVRIEPVAERS